MTESREEKQRPQSRRLPTPIQFVHPWAIILPVLLAWVGLMAHSVLPTFLIHNTAVLKYIFWGALLIHVCEGAYSGWSASTATAPRKSSAEIIVFWSIQTFLFGFASLQVQANVTKNIKTWHSLNNTIAPSKDTTKIE